MILPLDPYFVDSVHFWAHRAPPRGAPVSLRRAAKRWTSAVANKCRRDMAAPVSLHGCAHPAMEPLVGARTVTISSIRSSVSHARARTSLIRAPHSLLGRSNGLAQTRIPLMRAPIARMRVAIPPRRASMKQMGTPIPWIHVRIRLMRA